MPKMTMELDFAIVVQDEKGSHLLTEKELMALTAGSFEFKIDGKDIRFDFKDHCISKTIICDNEEEGLWSYIGGEGGLFKSYQLDDCYDEDYKELGISRDILTAEHLSKVSEINEIFVEWELKNNIEKDIASDNVVLLVQNISFVDMDTIARYNVSNDVIRAFNAKSIAEKPTVNLNTTPIDYTDYFFYRADTEEFVGVYFNPDSNAGGQFVIQHYPIDYIKENLIEAKYSETPVSEFNIEDFFDVLQEGSKTYLVDVNEPDFVYYLKDYEQPNPVSIGYTTETLNLMSFAANFKEVEIICYPNTLAAFIVSVPVDSTKDEEEQINQWLDDNIPKVCDDWIYISR